MEQPKITPAEAQVLAHVKANPGATPKQLMEETGIPASSIAAYVSHLFSLHLVTRVPNSADKRHNCYYPAPGLSAPASPPPANPPAKPIALGHKGQCSTEQAYLALKAALPAAGAMLDYLVSCQDDYDLEATYHLGKAAAHLAKFLQRRLP